MPRYHIGTRATGPRSPMTVDEFAERLRELVGIAEMIGCVST